MNELREGDRKVAILVVPSEWGGRDAGKTYKLVEMPAARSEKWAIRFLLLFNRNGARIPEELIGRGMEAIAVFGINVFLQSDIRYEELEPLLDEMMTCVSIIRDPRAPHIATPIGADSDIAEAKTRFWLRSEVLRLHTNFSPADALSGLASTILRPTEPEASSNT